MLEAPRRGSHRIFLGMAAGVGKTYRMLLEGQAEAESGRDVAIGYLEAHGRRETEELARDLELVPRRRVVYRETTVEEMDLPAILARSPELCLIDELAHTNAAGVEHEKRWEDVQAVLEAGIDVFSTVNVQHLESLNDQVAELTGTRVRETIPDSVIAAADEVVLIDITPQALVERLRAGKIYRPDRIEAALNNFFRIENLSALREVSLRQVAEEVEAKRLVQGGPTREDVLVATHAPQAVGERLLALITLSPQSQRVVRRAWRSAQRLGAELDLLWIVKPGGLVRAEGNPELAAVRRLASVLGAHVLVEEGEPMIDVITRVARERATTYILMGTPPPRSAFQRLTKPALLFQILRALPGVDLRIVADRTQRQGEGERMIALVVLLAAALVALAIAFAVRERDRRRSRLTTASPSRVLFPFTGTALSQRGLDAALRLARIDGATLVPAFLAQVPLHLPLDAALPRQCDSALPLLEAVEQRAARAGVAVDSRIERGRTYRHAIRQLVAHERFDTVVVMAGDAASPGLAPDDVSWLLEHVPGEIIVIRPAPLARATVSV